MTRSNIADILVYAPRSFCQKPATLLCSTGSVDPLSTFHTHHLSLIMSQLEQLRKLTTVVADSGDFKSYSALKGLIQDGTTNPSVRLLCFPIFALICAAAAFFPQKIFPAR